MDDLVEEPAALILYELLHDVGRFGFQVLRFLQLLRPKTPGGSPHTRQVSTNSAKSPNGMIYEKTILLPAVPA